MNQIKMNPSFAEKQPANDRQTCREATAVSYLQVSEITEPLESTLRQGSGQIVSLQPPVVDVE